MSRPDSSSVRITPDAHRRLRYAAFKEAKPLYKVVDTISAFLPEEHADPTPLVVTRHPGLVEYLRKIGLVDGSVDVLAHVDKDDVAGRHVIGVLPTHLAAVAAKLTVIPLDLPPELRGVELTCEQVEAHAGEAKTYIVREV